MPGVWAPGPSEGTGRRGVASVLLGGWGGLPPTVVVTTLTAAADIPPVAAVTSVTAGQTLGLATVTPMSTIHAEVTLALRSAWWASPVLLAVAAICG